MNVIELHVHHQRGTRTPDGGVFCDFSQRGYDVELYDRPDLAEERIEALREQGVRVEIAG